MYTERAQANVGGCVPCVPPETIVREKAQELMEAAYRIRNTADAIRDKMFGAVPCENSKNPEPQCLNDVLIITRDILQLAYNIISDVNDRL
jgi:hypothetical protein